MSTLPSETRCTNTNCALLPPTVASAWLTNAPKHAGDSSGDEESDASRVYVALAAHQPAAPLAQEASMLVACMVPSRCVWGGVWFWVCVTRRSSHTLAAVKGISLGETTCAMLAPLNLPRHAYQSCLR